MGRIEDRNRAVIVAEYERLLASPSFFPIAEWVGSEFDLSEFTRSFSRFIDKCQSDWHQRTRRWNNRLFGGGFLLTYAVFLIALALTEANNQQKYLLILPAELVVLGIVYIALQIFLRAGRPALEWQRIEPLFYTDESFRAHVKVALPRAMRVAWNSRPGRSEEDASSESAMSVFDDVDLVEMNLDRPVPVGAMDECFRFIATHPTSAIGLSGPRGIGKSTVIERMTRWPAGEAYVGVMISAPVKYMPTDFVRLIRLRVAEAVSDSYRPRKPKSAGRPALNARVVVSMGCIAAAAVVFFAHDKIEHAPWWARVSGMLLLIAGVLSGTSMARPMIGGVVRFLRREAANSVSRLAWDELDVLQFTKKTQVTRKNSFEFKPMTAEDTGMTELAERESSHPEHVAAFKRFAARFTAIADVSLIVAIDELDKIADVDEAVQVINSLKDVMHTPGVHFIVSVSDDALARFALRGLPLRDAFDSTFDKIIHLSRFTLPESFELLNERVLGMPEVLVYFCHALSGGVPRDLVRAARQCLEFGRRRLDDRPAAADVVRRVTKHQATEVLDGAVVYARAKSPAVVGMLARAARAVAAAKPYDLSRVLVAQSELLSAELELLTAERDELSEADPTMAAVPVAMAILATICECYGRRLSDKEWRGNAQHRAAAIDLALCNALLSVDSDLANEQHADFRASVSSGKLRVRPEVV